MLKFFFWILIAANVVLFAFQRTYFDAPSAGKREPERLAQQYRENQIRILSADEISHAAARAKAGAQNVALPGGCVEVGNFSKTEAASFERQLLPLSLPAENVHLFPFSEGSTYMVFIPPAASQKAAQARISELKEKGVQSYYLIKDQTKMRWAISLGVFKTREAAVDYASKLEKNGLSGLQIEPRGASVEKLVYRLDNLNAEQLKTLESVVGQFTGQNTRSCSPTPGNPA